MKVQPRFATSRLVFAFGTACLFSLMASGCAEQNPVEAVAPGELLQAQADHLASKAKAPVRLTFEKCSEDADTWMGTVGGDITGDLQTELLSAREAGPILHVTFDWIVDAGSKSFIAPLKGILNTQTGAVVMNGTVAEGWLEGARVHEEGQLVNPELGCFEGTIRIMPATAK